MRKLFIHNLLIVGIILSVIGCSEKKNNSSFLIVELDENSPEEDLRFNDLVDSVEVILLETTEASLVPGYFKYLCGEKYILVIGNESILQFARDGKFIRTLVKRGRAPEEYIADAGYTMNEETERFYITDWNHNLKIYNLQTGKFEKCIRTEGVVMTKMSFLTQDTLIFIPYLDLDGSSDVNLGCMTTDAQWCWNVKSVNRTGREVVGQSYLRYLDGEIHFMPDYVDTLYTVWEGQIRPLIYFDISNKYSLAKQGGNVMDIQFETPDFILANVWEQKIEDVVGGRSVYRKDKGHYLVYKKDGQVKKMRKFYTDILGAELSGPLSDVSCLGRRMSIRYGMGQYRGALGITISLNRQTPERTEELKKMFEATEEDGNPVIITGIMK